MKPQSQKQKELSPDNNEKRYNLRPRKTITRTNGQKGRKSTDMKTSTAQTKKAKEIIEKGENKSLSLTLPKKHINSLAPELLGRVFQWGLSVVDRFHCERVSPRWKWIVGAFAWSEQRMLDSEVVFEGVKYEGQIRFTHENLISLLACVAGPKLVELDLQLLGRKRDPTLVGQIAESLSLFTNLKTLNIVGFNFHVFVDFLPFSLCNLRTFWPINVQTLEKLSVRCPNLESVPFEVVENVNLDIVNQFMGKFPRQKTLNLFFEGLPNNATFEAIGKQKELVELSMRFDREFDEENERAFEKMAEGCESLRKICFGRVDRMTERALFHLAKIPSLTVVELHSDRSYAFTDSLLKAIAKWGQLKRLKVKTNELTDEGIVYLIDQCKSLVSLELQECPQISDRSLEAVVAEVHRRHGVPPRSLPNGPNDNQIFFFGILGTEIDEQKAHMMTMGNPWLEIGRCWIFGDLRADSKLLLC